MSSDLMNDEWRAVAEAVKTGLTAPAKKLPPWLFYDRAGSALYEQITELPEYYLTRAERSIFEHQSDAIIDTVLGQRTTALSVAELGAGTCSKSQLLVRAAVRRQGRTVFMPSDVSASPLALATARFAKDEPAVDLQPIVGHHEAALAAMRELPGCQLILFIGSSIGNYLERDARQLLRLMRQSLRPQSSILLGTDLRKPLDRLLPAYDDSQGVTARFNKNILTRINRELDADFDIDLFDHVAAWNESSSCVEMHLASRRRQTVRIDRLDLSIELEKNERIQTESSVKYDLAAIDGLLESSGFKREHTFFDSDRLFAVHLGRS